MNRCPSAIAVVLLSTVCVATFGKPLCEKERLNRLRTLHAKLMTLSNLNRLERAYVDATLILRGQNSCSEFFGGATSAEVLEDLVIRLQNVPMKDPGVGILMSGQSINLYNPETGTSYRSFAEAQINNFGPFYRSKVHPEDPLVPHIGSFLPNTREARVLILLHELGHLIKGPEGRWLIPDDGRNQGLS
ncbi:MAG: hypothetical protein C5B44_05285, partial [Acidobacteria bacterium]